MAEDHFSFLRDCEGTADVVVGDGRISLEREGPQNFDVLALDAFSGDSPPTHLLTREAFAIYTKHLRPGGVIAVNITSNYLDLAPVVRRVGAEFGLSSARVATELDEDRLVSHSDWLLLTRDAALLAAVSPAGGTETPDEGVPPLWTDDYSNLFQLVRWR
jgi:spermidine synthase